MTMGNIYRNILMLILVIVAVAAYGLVSNMAYEDEVAEHARCLEMVELKIWPAGVCR